LPDSGLDKENHMKSRFVRGLICLVALGAATVLTGCSTTPAQARSRARAHRLNMDMMRHEVDWIIGMEDASILYDETMAPYW
jgi:hypothetical protein